MQWAKLIAVAALSLGIFGLLVEGFYLKNRESKQQVCTEAKAKGYDLEGCRDAKSPDAKSPPPQPQRDYSKLLDDTAAIKAAAQASRNGLPTVLSCQSVGKPLKGSALIENIRVYAVYPSDLHGDLKNSAQNDDSPFHARNMQMDLRGKYAPKSEQIVGLFIPADMTLKEWLHDK